jgi:hypothetical protein
MGDPGIVIAFPEAVLQSMQTFFEPYRRQRLEACCIWYGPRIAELPFAVTTLVIPRQKNSAGNFHLTPEAIGAMADATRPLGLVARVQIHSHPGVRVDHSWYDDENAISRRVLSLVVPRYGNIPRRWPQGVGVHEFQDTEWVRLEDAVARTRLLKNDGALSVIDLR